MQFLLLSGDLMLMSAAQGAADRHGATVDVVGNVTDALARCAADEVALIAIDLRLPGLDVADAVARLRAATPATTFLAGGPHVQRDSLAAAVEAGCDEVVTRGEFERRLDASVAQLVAR